MPPPKKIASNVKRRKASPGPAAMYQPLKPAKPKGPQTKMTFAVPREVHQKLIEIGRSNGISLEEILTEALYEWFLSNGKANVAAILAGEAQ
jgi:hypothetical protein